MAQIAATNRYNVFAALIIYRSLINASCCAQLVILLYLLDNNTSFIILASSAVGLAIEFWKVRGWTLILVQHLAAALRNPVCQTLGAGCSEPWYSAHGMASAR